uniref:Uncharacterized protein n=1 Tax=Lactuca sativa TaxID=4236 RepID=A0A9R1XCT7_LACSA|nr:hypothetical protein LSAT_V11C500252550 [Lactuca sativa]
MLCMFIELEPEVAWHILDFPIHERDPPVMILPVHLENMQTAYSKEYSRLKDVVGNRRFAISPLLGWFNRNKDTAVRDNENQSNSENETGGLDLTYIDYPSKFCWDKTAKWWVLRHQSM